MPIDVRGKTFLRQADFKSSIHEDKSKAGEIPGLQCPDCGAQAFKTDQLGIAVCGDYPGWYFQYIQATRSNKPQYKVMIKNGQYVNVPVYKTRVLTTHP